MKATLTHWLHSNPNTHLGSTRSTIAYSLHSFNPKLNPLNQVIYVWSIEETITQVVERRMSVARFGDGDLHLMSGLNIDFQDADPTLIKQLVSVARSTSESLAVCIPDVFRTLAWATKPAAQYWKKHLLVRRKAWLTFFDSNRKYHNAFISRPYIDWRDKTLADNRFRTLKRIWDGRNVVVIEGENSRMGLGNSLLNNAASVARLLCPQVNAWSQRDNILEIATSLPKETLFLLSLGPAATALASQLDERSYQAVDIGQIDSEYEWFLRHAESRISVAGKFFNEARGANLRLSDDLIDKYQSEIMARLGV